MSEGKSNLNYKINNLHNLTVSVKIEPTKRLKIRLKIALFLIRLGLKISTMNGEFEIGGDE